MTRLNEVLDYKSKYTYPNGTLKNKLNILDSKELETKERQITNYKLANLYLKNITGKFDVEHYLSIHEYLFEDIYDFAGKIRNENIKKSFSFCVPEYIYDNLYDTLRKMQKDMLNIANEDALADFFATYYSDIDIIHPFREGNGRTLREFLRQAMEQINLNIDFGEYHLDYSKIENRDAFIKAVRIADATCDYSYLKEMMKIIITKKEKTK